MNKRALLNAVIGLTKHADQLTPQKPQPRTPYKDFKKKLGLDGPAALTIRSLFNLRLLLPRKALRAVLDHVIKPVPQENMPRGVAQQFVDAYKKLGITPDLRLVGDIGFKDSYKANYKNKELALKLYHKAMRARIDALRKAGVTRLKGTAPLVVFPDTPKGNYAAASAAGMRIYPSAYHQSSTMPTLWDTLFNDKGDTGEIARDLGAIFGKGDALRIVSTWKSPVFVNPYMHSVWGQRMLSDLLGRADSPYNNTLAVHDVIRHLLAHNTSSPAVIRRDGPVGKYIGDPQRQANIDLGRQLLMSLKPKRQTYMLLKTLGSGALARAKATMVNALGVLPTTIKLGIKRMLDEGYLVRQPNGRLVATEKLINLQHFPNTDLELILTNYDMSDRGQVLGNILHEMLYDPSVLMKLMLYAWPQVNNTRRPVSSGVV